MSDHFNTGPGFPQTRAEVEAASDEVLGHLMGRCGVEPADPDVCLACYAYTLLSGREQAQAKRTKLQVIEAEDGLRYRHPWQAWLRHGDHCPARRLTPDLSALEGPCNCGLNRALADAASVSGIADLQTALDESRKHWAAFGSHPGDAYRTLERAVRAYIGKEAKA